MSVKKRVKENEIQVENKKRKMKIKEEKVCDKEKGAIFFVSFE